MAMPFSMPRQCSLITPNIMRHWSMPQKLWRSRARRNESPVCIKEVTCVSSYLLPIYSSTWGSTCKGLHVMQRKSSKLDIVGIIKFRCLIENQLQVHVHVSCRLFLFVVLDLFTASNGTNISARQLPPDGPACTIPFWCIFRLQIQPCTLQLEVDLQQWYRRYSQQQQQ